tara:strand:+ start:1001 stop:1216 length:216 start_codon:yes stop_codon:yes gene_type:complete
MKSYIVKLYGSQQACAEALGVDRKTVYRWINVNTWPMAKYVDQIVKTSEATEEEVLLEILWNEDFIYKCLQ